MATTKPATTANTPTTTAPIKRFRIENVIASVFVNTVKREGSSSKMYRVSLQRSYREGGETKYTNSLGRQDLLPAALAMQKASAFINGLSVNGDGASVADTSETSDAEVTDVKEDK